MGTYEPPNRLPDVLDMMEGDGTLHAGESIVPSALLSRLGTSLPQPRVSSKSQAGTPRDLHQVAPMRRILDEVGDAVEACLEGALQRERALELVGEARTIIGWVAQQRSDAAGLLAEPAKLLEGVADHAFEDSKAAGWEKDDGASSLAAKADLDEVGFLPRSGWLGCSAARLTSISS